MFIEHNVLCLVAADSMSLFSCVYPCILLDVLHCHPRCKLVLEIVCGSSYRNNVKQNYVLMFSTSTAYHVVVVVVVVLLCVFQEILFVLCFEL